MLARTLNGMLERISDAVKRQRAFVAAASHDLRTPYRRSRRSWSWRTVRTPGPDELRTALHAARRTPHAARDDATRLGELARDLLQLATVSGEGRQVVLTTVDLADLFETVRRRVAPVAERAGVRVHSEVEHRTVRLDRVRIEQALANLLVNAVTYSSSGGEVDISSAADPVGRTGDRRGA